MAQYPTTRTVFELQKYSRGLPKQNEQEQSIHNSKDCDWHHHTQPIIRLLLESRKSPEGVPESVRMRIVWTAEHTGAAGNASHQNFVVFDDVDLAVVRKHVHPFPTHGLPLKAVYRDNMVGIRFLPPQAQSNASLEYRRFQVTFREAGAAKVLVEAIQDVCPCKPTPAKPVTLTRPDCQSGDILGSQATQAPHIHTQLYHQALTPQYRPALPAPSFSDDCSTPASQITQAPHARHSDFTVSSRASFPSQHIYATPASTAYQLPLNPNLSRHQTLAHEATFDHSFAQIHPAIRPDDRPVRRDTLNLPDQILPDLQEHSALIRPQMRPLLTPPASSQIVVDAATTHSSDIVIPIDSAAPKSASANAQDPLITSLYEACKLDHLSSDELERLVAHIIREDGFTELLEKIDRLWRIKALIND